jgi:HemY protein
LISLLSFFLKLGVVVAFAVWVADRSGKVTIEWKDMVLQTSTLMLVLSVGLIAMFSYSTAKLFAFFGGASYRMRMNQRLQRQRRAEKLLTGAVDALADEKNNRALGLLRRAEKLLGSSQVVDLLRKEAGETPVITAQGDYSSPFAWREAIEKKLKEGRLGEARHLAESFAAKHENLGLPRRMLFEVHAHEQNWGEALYMLDLLRETGDMPRGELRQARAAALAERARLALEKGNGAEAFEYARQADRLRPQWVPALWLAAKGLAMQDKPREAAGLIEKSWAAAPHPQLGSLYLSLRTGRNDLKKAQAAENLRRRAEDNPASHLLHADALFRAGIYAQARFIAASLAKTHPSREVFTLLSQVEEADHHPAAAQEWHKKAAESPLGEAWICSSCRQPHRSWQALCSSCKEFNTLSWQAQPAVIANT